MRISDWSSDVCSSDLEAEARLGLAQAEDVRARRLVAEGVAGRERSDVTTATLREREAQVASARAAERLAALDLRYAGVEAPIAGRVGQILVTRGNLVAGGETATPLKPEEHTSELQSLMPISYADVCWKK